MKYSVLSSTSIFCFVILGKKICFFKVAQNNHLISSYTFNIKVNLIRFSSSLACYKCDSMSDPNCVDPYKSVNISIQNCPNKNDKCLVSILL
jgi:hypothetical protein